MRRAALLALFFPRLLAASDLTIPAPGRLRDLSVSPGPVSGSSRSAGHVLAKFSVPLDRTVESALHLSGWTLETVLSRDSAVLSAREARPSGIAEIAWMGPLEPEDKASPELLGNGVDPIPGRISLLGHPGIRAADLSASAFAAGLTVTGARDSPFGARLEIAAGARQASLRKFLADDGAFAAFPRSNPRLANDRSVGTIQSGIPLGPTPIFDHGIFGSTQTIGILDTGLDVDSCFFNDPSNSFAVNTSAGGVYGTSTGALHRKIAAYDFLDSCDEFPAPCERPEDPTAYDNEGHGTHVAGNAAGDNLAHPLIHDPGDGMAPGARLIVQDGGYSADTARCGNLPGLGCAPDGLDPIFAQAYAQGARIHSDSWADDTIGPAPFNSGYSLTARDVDDFAFRHPDFLAFFAAGNAGVSGPRSVPSPGNGKDIVCVGSTRNTPSGSDEDLSDFSAIGPAADGRWKPDVVAPGVNVSASSDFSILTENCTTAADAGTSFATPTAAGAGALVRDYFQQGFYPDGEANPDHTLLPSAALVKAALIASAVPLRGNRLGAPVDPPPSNEQGFGRIELANVLAFRDSPFRLFVADVASAFLPGDENPRLFRLSVRSGSRPLRVVLVWTDPPGVPRSYQDSTPELVDDLDLSVEGPGLLEQQFDRINNVVSIAFSSPAPGDYTISVSPHFIPLGPAVGFALVATGDIGVVAEPGLALDAGSAVVAGGVLADCQSSSVSLRVTNSAPSASSELSEISIESLDSAVEVETPMPEPLEAIPPGGSAEFSFQVRAGFQGIPLQCGRAVPFRATIVPNGGAEVSTVFSLPAAPGPAGCGSVASLTCAPAQVRPIRLP
ncbi:MAG: S8 family serine peptidase [Thermoanaerobaculia bacterium]